MDCQFIILDSSNPKVKVCTVCNTTHTGNAPPEKVRRRCKAVQGDPTFARLLVSLDKRPPDNTQRIGQGKPMPGMRKRAWGFAKAMASFVWRPGFVSKDHAEARGAVCETCDERDGGWCTACGCALTFKVLATAWECPFGKWADVDRSFLPVSVLSASPSCGRTVEKREEPGESS